MKLSLVIILFTVTISHLITAQVSSAEQLSLIDTFMGKRLTNVGTSSILYPEASLGLVVNCHPYDPTTVAGSGIPACASHPLIVRYTKDQSQGFLPDHIQKILDTSDENTEVYLNVQDNPWNGTQIELRAHAFSNFFPIMGVNYQGVDVSVYRDDSTIVLKSNGSVHLHDGIASPSNFAIPGLNHTRNEAFCSVLTYSGKSVITRHIILTVSTREKFQDMLCVKTDEDQSLGIFTKLLGVKYSTFLNDIFGKNYDLLLEQKKSTVSFALMNAATYFGQNVCIIGNIAELGSWNTESSIPMEFQGNDQNWIKTLILPSNITLEYKYIKKDKGNIVWLGGLNLFLTTKDSMAKTDYWR